MSKVNNACGSRRRHEEEGKHKRALARQVYAAELPLRRRAANLQAAANRNESLNALKADGIRSELARHKGVLHLAPGDRHTTAAIDQLSKHLRNLAK